MFRARRGPVASLARVAERTKKGMDAKEGEGGRKKRGGQLYEFMAQRTALGLRASPGSVSEEDDDQEGKGRPPPEILMDQPPAASAKGVRLAPNGLIRQKSSPEIIPGAHSSQPTTIVL